MIWAGSTGFGIIFTLTGIPTIRNRPALNVPVLELALPMVSQHPADDLGTPRSEIVVTDRTPLAEELHLHPPLVPVASPCQPYLEVGSAVCNTQVETTDHARCW